MYPNFLLKQMMTLHWKTLERHIESCPPQIELKQFEEIERSLNMSAPRADLNNGQPVAHNHNSNSRRSPDKSSRDSGVITPSDGSVTSPESEPHPFQPGQQPGQSSSWGGRKPSDPLPQVQFVNKRLRRDLPTFLVYTVPDLDICMGEFCVRKLI